MKRLTVSFLFSILQMITYFQAVCLARIRHATKDASTTPLASVVVLNCRVPWTGEDDPSQEMAPVEILDADFFDDKFIIIVYRVRNREG